MNSSSYCEILRIPLSHGSLVGIVRSHGWSQLAPYSWDKETLTLTRIERFKQHAVHLKIEQETHNYLRCFVFSTIPIRSSLLDKLILRLKYMFNCDIDFANFLQKACSLDPSLYKVAKTGLNPFLRGSSLFEDVLKTLFTTNASWAFTRRMCQSLLNVSTKQFGWSESEISFPSVSQILSIPMTVFESEVRLGYRIGYLHNIAEKFQVCDEFVGWSTDPILQELSTIKGLGPYNINHIAMLLGKNDKIPIDSEVRRCMRLLGRSDDTDSIEEYYAKWAPYQNLAYRMERKLYQI